MARRLLSEMTEQGGMINEIKTQMDTQFQLVKKSN